MSDPPYQQIVGALPYLHPPKRKTKKKKDKQKKKQKKRKEKKKKSLFGTDGRRQLFASRRRDETCATSHGKKTLLTLKTADLLACTGTVRMDTVYMSRRHASCPMALDGCSLCVEARHHGLRLHVRERWFYSKAVENPADG